MKILKRVLTIILVVIVLAAAGGMIFLNSIKTRALPDYNAGIDLEGLSVPFGGGGDIREKGTRLGFGQTHGACIEAFCQFFHISPPHVFGPENMKQIQDTGGEGGKGIEPSAGPVVYLSNSHCKSLGEAPTSQVLFQGAWDPAPVRVFPEGRMKCLSANCNYRSP